MKTGTIIIIVSIVIILIGCIVKKEKRIKKEIKYGDLVIRLYDAKFGEKTRNLEAFGSDGKLVWIAEEPKYEKNYFDIEIDSEKKILKADAGAATWYDLDLSNGHILREYIVY